MKHFSFSSMDLKRGQSFAVLFSVLGLGMSAAMAQISYTGGTLTENFDGMGAAGTTTPANWYVGTAAAANTTGPLVVNNGGTAPSAIAGHNCGTANATDRALGLGATGGDRNMEVQIRNDTANSIPYIDVRYRGEQWRTPSAGSPGNPAYKLELRYSTDGVNYVSMGSAFEFNTPKFTPVSTALDANAAGNFTNNIGGFYAPASPIPPGGVIYLRWYDFNDANTDPILAIDDFTFAQVNLSPINITQSPVGANVLQGRSVTLSVASTGSLPQYQWHKAGVGPITGATASTYTIANANYPGDSGNYFVVVSNQLGQQTSGSATVTVQQDTQAPKILRVIRSGSAQSVTITFDEPMDPLAAVDEFSYEFREVGSATTVSPNSGVLANGTNITFTAAFLPDKNYTLVIVGTDLSDLFGNTIAAGYQVPVWIEVFLTPINDTFTWRYNQSRVDLGTAWKEPGYDDASWLTGGAVLDAKDTPRSTIAGLPVRTQLDQGPSGNRTMTMYFRSRFAMPGPLSGAQLHMRSVVDDGYVLYANGTEIYRESVPSNQVYTTAATRTVGDAAVEGPFDLATTGFNQGENVIAAEIHNINATGSDLTFAIELSVVVTQLFSGPVIIATQPQSLNVNEGQTASFTVVASGAVPLTYQWEKIGTGPISGATGASYIIPNVVPTEAGSYRVVISNPVGPVTSSTATLTVNADNVPPTMIHAVGLLGQTNIVISFSERLSASTAEDAGNYGVDLRAGGGGLTIESAVLTNGTNVILTTSPRVLGENYKVTAENVADASFAANLIPPNSSLNIASEVELISLTSQSWHYEESRTDLGTAWHATGFDDSAWLSGLGVFDGKDPQRTTVGGLNVGTQLALGSATERTTNIYFRTHFDLTAATNGAALYMRGMIDDGAVLYINGQEAFRIGMPVAPAPIAYTNLATRTVGDAAVEGPYDLPITNLVSGNNVIAAEVHQVSATSSDITWTLQLVGVFPTLPPNSRLTISTAGGMVTISWTGTGTLEVAPAVTGPWSNSANQNNPQTFSAPATPKFFRVRL